MTKADVVVSDEEMDEVLSWAYKHVLQGTTDHENGSYEEGVADTIRWLLGAIKTRPDQP